MAKTNTGKATEPVEKVGVIILSKVDEAVLDRSLELVGEPTSGTLEEKIRRLGNWFSESCDAEANLVECDRCKGIADITKLDDSPLPHACPFCNDGDEPVEREAPKAKAAPAPKAKAAPKIVETTGETKEDKVVDISKARGQKMQRVKTSGGKAAEPKPTRAIEKRKDSAVVSEAELDAAVDDYKQAVVEGVTSYVRISHILRMIDEKKLWKGRLDSNGARAYESFEQFAHAELKMSKGHAYRAIAVAKAFTPEEIQKHGFRKLAIIANFGDPVDKAKLLKLLEQGASKRGLEKEAGKLRGRETEEDTEGKVTVALMMKRVRIPMLARGKGEKPAKRLQDDPHGELELTNGVSLKFVIGVSKSGQIELVVSPRRAAE